MGIDIAANCAGVFDPWRVDGPCGWGVPRARRYRRSVPSSALYVWYGTRLRFGLDDRDGGGGANI